MNHFDTYFSQVNRWFSSKDHEHVNDCRLCGEKMSMTYRRIYGELYNCDKCNFTWLATQPTLETLNKFYEESEAMTTWSDIKAGGYDDKRQNDKYSVFWNFINGADVDSVLDIGCGTGYFLNHLPRGVDGLGLDPNDASVRHCRVPVVEDPTQIEQKYDMMTMFGVLEHLKDPKGIVNDYSKYLNNGGYLGIIVPNIDSLAFQVLGEQVCSICPQHLWYFNIHTLSRLLRDCGFDMVKYTTVESELQPILRKMNGLAPYSKVGGIELSHPHITEQTILEKNLGAKVCAIFKKTKIDTEVFNVKSSYSNYSSQSRV